VYTFTAEAGQVVFFDLQDVSGLSGVDWKAVDQDGTVIFETCMRCGSPGDRLLERGGAYTITVGESGSDATGSYRLQVWDGASPASSP
jgi:hypothetical protein